MKLEVVVLPVSDVDRAKAFYQRLGWREDADFAVDDGYRVVQFTPPASEASGVAVSELWHDETGIFHHAGTRARVAGPHPERADYSTFASFEDPDGNGWILQEITKRLPGR